MWQCSIWDFPDANDRRLGPAKADFLPVQLDGNRIAQRRVAGDFHHPARDEPQHRHAPGPVARRGNFFDFRGRAHLQSVECAFQNLALKPTLFKNPGQQVRSRLIFAAKFVRMSGFPD